MPNLVSLAYRPKPTYRLPRPGNDGTATANHANSTSPVDATLANATAGYATLGGRWSFAAILTAATDYALFAYQNPSTHRLVINGIAISSILSAIDMATTPTIFDWSLGVNGTAIDLGTADGAGAFATRRIPLGLQTFLVADKIGARPADIIRSFKAPLIVEPSRYVHVILQVPLGTATSNQKFRGDVMFDGYFEAADSLANGL